MSFKKVPLSADPRNQGLKITPTDLAGAVVVHTAISGTNETQYDEVSVMAHNSSVNDVKIFMDLGSGDSARIVEQIIQKETGMVPVLLGHRCDNATEIKAYAETADVISLTGDVDRFTTD